MLGEHTIYARHYRLINDRKLMLRHSFMLQQLYQTNALMKMKQESRLMLTNLRDAFIGQSRSPNIPPFHILGRVSYCAIVTLSFRRAVFTTFDFKKCHDLEIVVKGH